MNNYNYLISIDPAGIGSSAIVVVNEKTKQIIFKDTYKSVTVTEAKNYFLELFQKLELPNNNVLVWVENFYLNKKRTITNPLSTPKLIGMLEVIAMDIMKWDFDIYAPYQKNKFTFSYQGNMKFTKHEKDAYKGIMLFRSTNNND